MINNKIVRFLADNSEINQTLKLHVNFGRITDTEVNIEVLSFKVDKLSLYLYHLGKYRYFIGDNIEIEIDDDGIAYQMKIKYIC